MHRTLLSAAVLAFVMLAGLTAQQKLVPPKPPGGSGPPLDQWPQFRGTQAGSVPDNPALPDTWSETQNVVWKTDIPGYGWSSPVVWNDHIFLTASISATAEVAPVKGLYDPGDDNGKMRSTAEHRWMVYDVDFASGKIRWQRELLRSVPKVQRHIKNSF